MIDFLKSFKSLIKFEEIRTDNNVFKLHYKFTVILLIVFSLLLTSKQYFGEPIACQAAAHQDYVNTYCWILGTYILPSTVTSSGSRLSGLGNEKLPGVTTSFQKYYQWVCIVFCFQALLFYVPRYIWKSWEGGRLRLLVKDLNSPLVTHTWSMNQKKELVYQLLNVKYAHNLYAFRYVGCEVLNFINVVTQIGLMDLFLSGDFTFYGVAVAVFRDSNAMGRMFPKVAKCSIERFGPSGDSELIDTICVLPLNMLNEKLFLVLWFWFITLAILSGASLIYRMFIICCPTARVYLLMAQARHVGPKKARFIISELSYGDFFILYHMGKNINPLIFKELVLEIYSSLRATSSHKVTSSSGVHSI